MFRITTVEMINSAYQNFIIAFINWNLSPTSIYSFLLDILWTNIPYCLIIFLLTLRTQFIAGAYFSSKWKVWTTLSQWSCVNWTTGPISKSQRSINLYETSSASLRSFQKEDSVDFSKIELIKKSHMRSSSLALVGQPWYTIVI